MQGTIILPFLTALIIVVFATPALIKVSYLKRLVDEPGEERKLHKRRVPTIGGIMIFAGTLFAYLMWFEVRETDSWEYIEASVGDFKYIGASMIILFFIGVKDDIIGTAAIKKLAGHLVVAFLLVIMAGIKITSMHGLFGIHELNEGASIALSIFTYTVIVNAFNLIDGVDGLASGVGAIVCLSFGTWFYMAGGQEDAVLAFALAGALAGFLLFNFSPANIFMGDSGSLTIGLVVSVLAIKMIEYSPYDDMPALFEGLSSPVVAMAVLAYPLIDTLRIFIYRAVRGVSPFSADRNHIHHLFLDAGFSHAQTVISIYGYNLFIIALAVFIPMDGPNRSFAVVGGTALVTSQMGIFLLKRNRKKPAA